MFLNAFRRARLTTLTHPYKSRFTFLFSGTKAAFLFVYFLYIYTIFLCILSYFIRFSLFLSV
nr:MAG TPA: hypothetical protein [Caudoviricetes sp.]